MDENNEQLRGDMIDEVPLHISRLLSDDFDEDYDVYVWLGTTGNIPQKVGIISQMVAAHSLVLRKVFAADHIWYDYMYNLDLPDIPASRWRNVLMFVYGHNCADSLTFQEQVGLLSLANELCIDVIKLEIMKRIKLDFPPQHVCQVLRDPALLRIKEYQFCLQKVLYKNTKVILNSRDLELVIPEYMSFILFLMQTGKMGLESYFEMWRVVIRWAKAKVLKDQWLQMPSNMATVMHSRIVEPHVPMQRLCARNLIRMVEDSEDPWLSDEQKLVNRKVLAHYHTIPTNPPFKLYMCTGIKNFRHVKHELFNITVLEDSSSWTQPLETKSSWLHLTVGSSPIELYSVVCSGMRYVPQDPKLLKTEKVIKYDQTVVYYHAEQTMYNCECTARLWVITEDKKDTKLYELVYNKKAVVNENFTITFRHISGTKLMLKENTEYKLEMLFSTAHPLWLEMTPRLRPARADHEVNVKGGPVEQHKEVGTHVKYVLYKTYKPEKAE